MQYLYYICIIIINQIKTIKIMRVESITQITQPQDCCHSFYYVTELTKAIKKIIPEVEYCRVINLTKATNDPGNEILIQVFASINANLPYPDHHDLLYIQKKLNGEFLVTWDYIVEVFVSHLNTEYLITLIATR